MASTLCFCLIPILFAATLSAQDIAGRQAAQARTIQHLEEHFDRLPMAKWSDRERSDLPGLLSEELEAAKVKSNGLEILGVLDCIEKYTKLSPDELELMAQITWTEGFYADSLKAGKKTRLAVLLTALDRERRGASSGGERTSAEIVRSDQYGIIDTVVTWEPLRSRLLRYEVRSILAGQEYLLHGDLPEGFAKDWLVPMEDLAEKWDQAWDSAWKTRNITLVAGLFGRMPNYRPKGLSREQKEALLTFQRSDWGLPYLVAKVPKAERITRLFEPEFMVRVRVAHLIATQQLAEAEVSLIPSLATPRDWYELSLLQESIGTESALTSLIAHEEDLRVDPQMPGWSLEQANARLMRINEKLGKIRQARVAYEAEAARKAETERQEVAHQKALERRQAAKQAEAERREAERRLAAKQEAARRAEVSRQESVTAAMAFPREAQPGGSQELVWGALVLIEDDSNALGFEMLLTAANQGNINAQFLVGSGFEKGLVVKKDREEAIRWLRICVARGELMTGASSDAIYIRAIARKAKEKLEVMGVR